MKGILSNRKILYVTLGMMFVFVMMITIVYAALNTTLKILGSAEVSSADWNVYFDNIKVNTGSVSAIKSPSVSNFKTVDFDVELNKPGDYYKFNVDIVNGGSVDAMIESIVKSPELTSEQAKYIKYEIEYIDGNLFNSKQLLSAGESRTISVLVSFRTDISSVDLPVSKVDLDLSFTLVYTQADESSNSIPNSNPAVRFVSGDLNTVGSEICVGEECFYLISSDENSVTMLSKYNLYAGSECFSMTDCISYGEEATGIQNSEMIGYPTNGVYPRKGVLLFSNTKYWEGKVTSYPAYVYDSNSLLYDSVEKYRLYLENMDASILDVRLIRVSELENLGCSLINQNCNNSQYAWVYSSSYWTGDVVDNPVAVSSIRGLGAASYNDAFGIRPVVVVSMLEF